MDEEWAKKLFREYANGINRDFYSEEEFIRMSARCIEIADTLARNNFYIFGVRFVTLVREPGPKGAMINVGIISHTLLLRALTDDGEAREIDRTEAVSKLYDAPRPMPAEMVEELLKSLSGVAAEEYAYSHCRNREWEFTDKDRHVFKRALVLHWDALERFLFQQNIRSPRFEYVSLILSRVGKMAPAGVDIIIFDFLFEKEKAYLEEREADFKLECGCPAGEHLEILDSWRERNRGPDQ